MLVTLRAGNTVDGPYRAGNDLVKVGRSSADTSSSLPWVTAGLSQPYYGSTYPVVRPNAPSVPAAGWTPQENERSEQDVMYVIDLVAKEYNVDTGRIFIHGQNPSGSGALHLAAKYPEKFAGADRELRTGSSRHVSVGPHQGEDGYAGDPRRSGHQQPDRGVQKMAEEAKAAGVDTSMRWCRAGRIWRPF